MMVLEGFDFFFFVLCVYFRIKPCFYGCSKPTVLIAWEMPIFQNSFSFLVENIFPSQTSRIVPPPAQGLLVVFVLLGFLLLFIGRGGWGVGWLCVGGYFCGFFLFLLLLLFWFEFFDCPCAYCKRRKSLSKPMRILARGSDSLLGWMPAVG